MAKESLVMGFGTFDAFHPGHLFYIKELNKLGDRLTIVVARDTNVERIKGKAPHFEQDVRLQAVQQVDIANLVVLGNESDFFEVIRQHEPDILGFGYDQRVNEEEIIAAFPSVKIVRVGAHEPHKYKSSIIKAKL